MADVETLTRIEDVLERIRPALHADGGDVELVDFDEEGFVHLQMLGACGGCPILPKCSSAAASRGSAARSCPRMMS